MDRRYEIHSWRKEIIFNQEIFNCKPTAECHLHKPRALEHKTDFKDPNDKRHQAVRAQLYPRIEPSTNFPIQPRARFRLETINNRADEQMGQLQKAKRLRIRQVYTPKKVYKAAAVDFDFRKDNDHSTNAA